MRCPKCGIDVFAHGETCEKVETPAVGEAVGRNNDGTYTLTANLSLERATAELVRDFAQALMDKVYDAERKYGYSDGWRSSNWMDECRQKLRAHLEKGDPRDVAAYCAFLWYHKESTALKGQPDTPPTPREGLRDDKHEKLGMAAERELDRQDKILRRLP